jgi:hypothetical protein
MLALVQRVQKAVQSVFQKAVQRVLQKAQWWAAE